MQEKIYNLEKKYESILLDHQDFLFNKYGYSPEIETRIKILEYTLKQESKKILLWQNKKADYLIRLSALKIKFSIFHSSKQMTKLFSICSYLRIFILHQKSYSGYRPHSIKVVVSLQQSLCLRLRPTRASSS